MWLAVFGLGVFVPGAGAYIYWANSQNDTIGRAENDGSGVDPNFISTGQQPSSVTVDAGHVYWANQKGGSIGRANINGTEVDNSFITGINEPNGVAVNESSIFWSSLDGYVGKANLNGTSPKPTFISAPENPCGVALDSGHVYWADVATGTPAYIGRAGLDGGSVQPTYVTIEIAIPCGVAVNTANIYWADLGFLGPGTRIGRANTSDGMGVDESFIGGADAPCGLALYDSRLYWANADSGTIGRANSDGTEVDQSFVETGGDQICGVAVDSLSTPPPKPLPIGGGGGEGGAKPPPQTTIKSGPGKKLAQGRARFSFTSNEAGSTFECRLDRKKIAPCHSPKSYKGLRPGRHSFSVWATDVAGSKDPTPAKRSFRVRAG